MNHHAKRNRSLITVLLLSLLIISGFILNKVVEGRQGDIPVSASSKGSHLVAKEGLEKERLHLKKQMAQIYEDVYTRYERLSPSEKAAFDIQKVSLYQIRKQFDAQIDLPKTWENAQQVNGIQSTVTTMLKKEKPSNHYTIEVTGQIGGEQTKLKQSFELDLDVPTTMKQSQYKPPYAIHATHKIVVQNASKVWGLLASKDPRNITIDGSSCQYELVGQNYLNECHNDGTAKTSDLKIWNEQSFKNFLPTFPTKEIELLDEQPYNEEEQYITKVIKNPDPEKKDKKIKYYYLQNSVLTVTDQTKKAFSSETPYQFTSSEERLQQLTLDGIDAYIDIGDGVQTLRLDTLNLMNGATLNVVGSGTLKLFIQEMGESEGEIVAEEAKVATYFDGDVALQFSKNFKSSGFIYVKKADLTLEITSYKENILSGGKQVIVNGGTAKNGRLLLAPKANIEITEGTNFKGSIIGRSVVINASNIQYEQPKKDVKIPITYAQYEQPKHFALYGPIKQFK